MMIQAADLLATTKRPTEAQIRTAMNGHLCRCGTYPRILTAIQKAAAVMAKAGAVTMTEFLQREFSRTSFVKGGGALIVGFSLAGAAAAGRASAANGRVGGQPARTRRRSTPGSGSTPTTRSTC